jgi:selenocysteine lyase/cysteine desulfurase
VLTSNGSSRELIRAVQDLRRIEFPWTAETTYLNNASIGPLPERTRRVLDDFTALRTTPHLLPDTSLMGGLAGARATVSRLLNADVEEVALATNTSYGLNVAAISLPLQAGETVLVSDKEFPANVYPWLMLRDRGIAVELAPTTSQGWPDEDLLLERLRDPSVRVLAVSFVQFSNGYRADLTRLGEACRANGTFFVVDAIQGVGQCPLDVRAMPIDLLACGAQKWLLSPWGSGFLYVRRELIPDLHPRVARWLAFQGTDDFTRLTDYDATFRVDARRFELATLPFQDLLGMTESIGLLLDVGVEQIHTYLEQVRRPLLAAADAGVLELASPIDPRHASSIVCVRTPHVEESYSALRRAGVVCVMREGSIRLSPHVYNTVAEIEQVVDILEG